MSPWLCKCGRSGSAPSKDRAAADWHVHARRRGCARISRQQLVDAMRGQLVLASAPGGSG